jgi:hypothetical protein
LTHGDPYLRNLALDRERNVRLIDLEDMSYAIGPDRLPAISARTYVDQDEPQGVDLAAGDGDPMLDIDEFVTSVSFRLERVVGWPRTRQVLAEFVAGYEAAWPGASVAERVTYVLLLRKVQDLDSTSRAIRGGHANPTNFARYAELVDQVRDLLGLS